MGMEKLELIESLNDLASFSKMKDIQCPPLYLLGGSACIIQGYLDRATRDIDILDLDYPANVGRLFKILGQVDYLDIELTTIPLDYASKATRISEINGIEVYVLCPEDIICAKLGRYSEKDKEDISFLIRYIDATKLAFSLEKVLHRTELSSLVKRNFEKNLVRFRGDFNV